MRDVSPGIARCELTYLERQPIDYERAVKEHERYRDVLRDLGLEVVSLPGDAGYPDCCFVEDTAVVLDEIAVITRPGAESRRGETAVVAEALAAWRHVVAVEPPGTLDGGDVLVTARKIFVGRSRRTNGAGIEALRAIVSPHGYEVVPVAVTGCLHLKSAVTAIDEGSVIANRDWVDLQPFRGFEVVPVPPGGAVGGERAGHSGTSPGERRITPDPRAPGEARVSGDSGATLRVPEGGGRRHVQEPPLPTPPVCLLRRARIGSRDCRAIEGASSSPPRKERMLRKTVVLAVALASLAGGCKGKEGSTTAGAEKKTSAEDQFKTEDEKVIYAFGAMLGTRFAAPLSSLRAELEIAEEGHSRDTAGGGKPAFPLDDLPPQARRARQGAGRGPRGRGEGQEPGLPRPGGAGAGCRQDALGPRLQVGQVGLRAEPLRHGHGARPLSGHVHGRKGLRQLDQARPARGVPPERA